MKIDNKPLPKKYLDALLLVEEGNVAFKDIAKTCGIPEHVFYDLMENRIENYGTIGEKFTNALNEINTRRDKEIKNLTKKNKKSAQYIIDKYLCDVKKRKVLKKEAVQALIGITNALSKSTPGVEIGSFTYQKGLSAEDIYAEFKRLSGLASERRTVQSASEERTGEVPVAPGPGSATSEEPEDTVL